ncbi:MAG: 4Fe-4S binding protein [Candidatus Ranarchaeia archaeon]
MENETKTEKISIGLKLRQITMKVTRGVHPIRIFRRFVQLLSLILLNGAIITLLTGIPILSPITSLWVFANLFGFLEIASTWVQSYFLVIPVLQTYSAPYTVVAGVFGALQRRITSGVFPFLEVAIILLTSVTIGRGFCGWVCPFGTIQDIVAKIPLSKIKISPSLNKDLSEIKYYILGVIIVICSWVGISVVQGVSQGLEAALGTLAYAPFNALSPQTTIDTLLWTMFLEGTLPTLDSIGLLLAYPPFFWVRIGILGFVLVLSLIIPRAFCRYFCPLGALMGIFSKFSIFTFSRKPVRCSKLRNCELECPMGIRILNDNYERINSRECINCGRCYATCLNRAITPQIF